MEPRSAAQRQENGQQRGAGGPESAAGERAQAERTPGTVKFLVKLFSKSLQGRGVPVARELAPTEPAGETAGQNPAMPRSGRETASREGPEAPNLRRERAHRQSVHATQ